MKTRGEDHVPPFPGDGTTAGTGDGRHRHPDDAEALRAAVEQSLQVSAQRNRRVLAAALAPVVGGALRQSVANVFKRAVIALNRFLVLTFSADGLRWRFEALRTGKTFEAVVREHSLVEPVTQVFLIHRRTGLLLAQVMQPEEEKLHRDGDMVSGMLTAVQDFVHDSFNVKAEDMLEVIRVGDLSVLIEQGPHAILAGIVSQGFEPQALRDTFRRALVQIHTEFAMELEHFNGDVSGFETVNPILERCLKLSLVKGEERISPLTGVLLAAPVLAGLVLGGLFVESSLRWRRYLEALEHEPGIVVLETGWRGGMRTIRGLRDPMAVDPADRLLDFGMTSGDVRADWTYYQALDEALLLARVQRAIEIPATVNMAIRDGIIVLDGRAPAGWKADARFRLMAIQGFRGLRMDALQEEGAELQAAWERYVKQLKQTPGIAVLDAEWRDSRFHIAGLRDPLAPDPDVLLAEAGLAEAPVTRQWTAYQALHPQLVLVRARRVLAPPASVSMELQDGVLKLSGRASNAWIREASLMVRGLAGIERTDLSSLEDSDLAALKTLVPTLEEPVFFFLADRQSMWPGQERKFNAFLEAVRRFEQLSRRIGMPYVIEIRGHAPASGDTEVARQASLAIAERFYARLQQGNVNVERFTRHGAGGDAAPAVGETDARRREAHVSFLVREAE